MLTWAQDVSDLNASELRFMVEPTGIYHEFLVQFLYQHQATVYLVNPSRVRKFAAGWLYLAVIMDLYSRAIVGRSMGNRMTRQLMCDALTMALFRREFPKEVIIHSDRGSQYCSKLYQGLIKKKKRQLRSLVDGLAQFNGSASNLL